MLACVTLAACHHAPAVRPQVQPDVELAQALDRFHHGDCGHAIPLLKRLTFEYGAAQPELAQVRYYLAECYFQSGDYVEAAHAFRQVADEHATSEYAPTALLRAGDANLRLWRLPDLDPSYGQSALAIYQELEGRYPGTPAAVRATLHVRQLRELFAQKAYKNGMFYYRRKAWDSAIIYFKDVIANCSETPGAADALLRLVESYHAIGYTAEEKETCAHLQRYYPKARSLAKTCPPSPS